MAIATCRAFCHTIATNGIDGIKATAVNASGPPIPMTDAHGRARHSDVDWPTIADTA